MALKLFMQILMGSMQNMLKNNITMMMLLISNGVCNLQTQNLIFGS